ncbi:hypothetical protein [Rhizobium sp. WYJ-E13]|uniref:hypothetical protein n=1 Tax=Rhizobium sp. WYJ-E13 TaxID=2849093 RepID=UPI001C1EE878|nr:hypothetical protein [Rhizobium sp. WYJ-E13]QWW70148.1 hypothetical protein KQ933_10820 [Rhizobium sp. WYJ-E13]
MRRLLSFLAIIGLIASVAAAEDVKKPTVDLWINEIGAENPLMEAILKDHMDEAVRIDSLLQAENPEAGQNAMVAVQRKYSNRAFSRASDAAAIQVIKKSAEIIDFFSENYPQGCFELLHKQLSFKAVSILNEKRIYSPYQEIQRLAYEDGKNRAPVERMDIATMYDVVTKDLGVSDDEIDMIVKSESTPAPHLCSIMKKYLNIEAVRESQRGQYARANISSKRAE